MEFLRPSDDPASAVAQLGAWLEASDPELLLIETSGSTGRPKRVLLTRDAMTASVVASAQRLSTPVGRWALRLPSSYVAGVQVILRSLMAGHAPVLGGWADAAGEAAYTSLVPTQLHRLMEAPDDVAALASMAAVLLGGGPIDPELRRRAETAGIRIVATYGASETGGGCVYDGVPLDGVAVGLGGDARIRIAGPTIFSGYEGDSSLTAETLVDGWYLTSDAGRLDEDGHLVVLGRIDDVVLSGGVNVPLPAVAARLREHPALAQVEVLGLSDPEWGQSVVAFAVTQKPVTQTPVTQTPVTQTPVTQTPVTQTPETQTAAPPDLADVRDWVAAVHPRAWAPRRLVLLKEFPLLANGKIDRLALQGLATKETSR